MLKRVRQVELLELVSIKNYLTPIYLFPIFIFRIIFILRQKVVNLVLYIHFSPNTPNILIIVLLLVAVLLFDVIILLNAIFFLFLLKILWISDFSIELLVMASALTGGLADNKLAHQQEYFSISFR